MVDYHLARLYQVETKRLNKQIKGNVKRFPESFMFQLSNSECNHLQSQIATSEINFDLLYWIKIRFLILFKEINL